MNFQCNTQELIEAVGNAQRAVASKAALPALEGLLLRAQGNTLFLAGFDMEIGITTTIEANVLQPGEIVLPARMFGDIVRKMPGDRISLDADDKFNTTICSEATEFSIMGITAADYPAIPTVEEGISLSLSQEVLKSMVRQTIFSVAAPNNPRPIYTGTRFEVAPDMLRLISMDGYRLAMRSEPVKTEENVNFVVPGKALQEILKLLKEEDKPCTLIIGRRHIIFEIDGYAVISRLLEGEFMDYQKIIAQEDNGTTVLVNTRSMMEAVDRVSLVINDRLQTPMICEFRDGAVYVSCSTPLGKANDCIPAEITGHEETMGFNSRYLLDALKNSETDEVRIELNSALKPMKIFPKEGSDFLFLVLPVRLK